MKWRFLMLVAIIAMSLFACKNKKTIVTEPVEVVAAVDSSAIFEAQKNLVADSLNAIINGTSALSLEEQQSYVDELKSRNFSDAKILNLIIKASDKIKEALEARNVKVKPLKNQLEENFAKIMNAASYAEADMIINETLEKFESPETPVLIILYRQNDEIDYDKPTTIKDYLNYLKLQKKSNADIDQVFLNTDGKIKSLDLMHK
ncbi:MAG: hypothetical protein KAI79_05670 [Bacteroidales bacterium]|nr:hypothetical protein [Bacteroidales bacterium]